METAEGALRGTQVEEAAAVGAHLFWDSRTVVRGILIGKYLRKIPQNARGGGGGGETWDGMARKWKEAPAVPASVLWYFRINPPRPCASRRVDGGCVLNPGPQDMDTLYRVPV